jgi:predicted enzyme related to lactoylglutathione lyase
MPAPRGKFIWYDVMTNDTKASTAFYSDVIGWQAQEYPMADNRTYTVFSKGPMMVAGLMAISDELRAEGVKPCWSGYIASDSVDTDAARRRDPEWPHGSPGRHLDRAGARPARRSFRHGQREELSGRASVITDRCSRCRSRS